MIVRIDYACTLIGQLTPTHKSIQSRFTMCACSDKHSTKTEASYPSPTHARVCRCVPLAFLVVLILHLFGVSHAHAAGPSFPDCSSDAPLGDTPICDSSLSVDVRVADLISRLTLTEKIGFLGDNSPAISRLRIPSYEWWSEGLHGIGFSPGVNFTSGPIRNATSFPSPIILASTFDRLLMFQVGSIISQEGRVMNNQGQAGLTFFTPNVNLFRDPRWGRGQETPGEDPYLTGQYVQAMVEGLQGGGQEDEDEPSYLKIVANCKHFYAYDLEDWGGIDRYHFNAIVNDRDMIESYLPPFEACVKYARAASVMCSYNAVNGVPACADSYGLTKTLRNEYKFEGFVVSDCGAIGGILEAHHYTTTKDETVKVALRAGVDLNCGNFYQDHTLHALENGVISENDIDRAITRSLSVLLRTGWFDPSSQQPYRQLGPDAVNTPEAQALALRVATDGMVLLKNEGGGALPWPMGTNDTERNIRTLALIGPLRNASVAMLGNYYGNPPFMVDPESAFNGLDYLKILSEQGCDVDSNDTRGFEEAIQAALSADAIIFIGGITQDQEAEGHDRSSLDLPGVQRQLIEAIAAALTSSGGSKRFLVTVFGGGPIDLSFARDSPAISSILWLGYPGQSGGSALMQLVSGAVSPAGRLPVTMYPAEYAQQVSMVDMSFRQSATNPGRTHRFYPNTSAVYPFGSGLTYTNFSFEWEDQEAIDGACEYGTDLIDELPIRHLHRAYRSDRRSSLLSYRVNVSNIGRVTSDIVVMLFLYPDPTFTSAPRQQLIGFDRLNDVAPGQTQSVLFAIETRQLALVDERGDRWLMPGEYTIGVDQPTRTTRKIRLTGLRKRLR